MNDAQELELAWEDRLDDARSAQTSPEEDKSSDQRRGVIAASGEVTR